MTKSEAGRRGGLATLEKHGIEHMSKVGLLGGRPRFEPVSEILERQALEKMSRGRKPTSDLGELRRMWRASEMSRPPREDLSPCRGGRGQ